jgi:hypothetical protein
MVGVKSRLDGDVVINPYSWNTVVFRNGDYYSVNHYPRGTSVTTGRSMPERFEFRYALLRVSDWDNQKMDPSDYGVSFDSRGYAVVPV